MPISVILKEDFGTLPDFTKSPQKLGNIFSVILLL